MIFLKIVIDLACGALFSWGGYSFLAARRFIMPSLLAVSICLILHSWWLGFMVLPVMATLILGYKDFGQGNFARAVWLMVQALVIGLGLLLTHHLAWYLYLSYAIIAGALAGILNNRVKQINGDVYFGCWLGMILFLIYLFFKQRIIF